MQERQRANLAEWLSERLGGEATISDLIHHAEGFSWQTYTLTVTVSASGTRHGYALRCEPPDGVLAPYDLAGQYALHRELLEHRIAPVPELFWLEPDASIIGMPFYVMARAQGRVPGPLDRAPFTAAEHEPIAEQFVTTLAAIHRAPWNELASVHAGDAAAQVEKWEEFYLRAKLHDVPALDLAFAWLRDNLVEPDRLALCHGDYRLGNLMVDGGRISAVFDWELAHVSDAVEDLAWTALPAFRGRARDRVAHLMTVAEFIDRYEHASATAVEPERFRFWTILAHVKAVAIYLQGAKAFEEGRTRDLRMAVVGNRSVQLIHDLLEDLP